MTDREKVVQKLEEVIAEAVYPDRPRKFMMPLELAEDTLALMKAQEPVKPIENAGFYYCGACRYAFTSTRQKYCSDCGRAVKWDV